MDMVGITIEGTRATITLPDALANLALAAGEEKRITYDQAIDRITHGVQAAYPEVRSFRIVGPKLRAGGGGDMQATGGAGGTDPEVLVQ